MCAGSHTCVTYKNIIDSELTLLHTPMVLPKISVVVYKERILMLTAIIFILVILWAVGFFAVHIGGGLIHILLVIALVVLVYNLLVGKRSV